MFKIECTETTMDKSIKICCSFGVKGIHDQVPAPPEANFKFLLTFQQMLWVTIYTKIFFKFTFKFRSVKQNGFLFSLEECAEDRKPGTETIIPAAMFKEWVSGPNLGSRMNISMTISVADDEENGE